MKRPSSSTAYHHKVNRNCSNVGKDGWAGTRTGWLQHVLGHPVDDLITESSILLGKMPATLALPAPGGTDNVRGSGGEGVADQRRRIVLDPQTLALLRVYLQHAAETATSLGIELAADSFVFSPGPDHLVWLNPDTVTQRYSRMCKRLGWKMHIHQLRHYSATELTPAGVDIRTVAGRLGHGGGGTTTLRVYSARLAEADQRAAVSLSARMPELTVEQMVPSNGPVPMVEPMLASERPPHLTIVEDLRGAIRCGALPATAYLPTQKSLAMRYSVSETTVQRAIKILRKTGKIISHRGGRATVAPKA